MRIDALMMRVAQVVDRLMSQGLQFRGGIRRRDKTRTGRPATVVTDGGERGRRKETKTRQRSWREGRGENGRGGSGRGAENSGRAEMRDGCRYAMLTRTAMAEAEMEMETSGGERGARDEVREKHTTCYPSSREMDESAKWDWEQGKRAVVLWAKKRAGGPVKWVVETM